MTNINLKSDTLQFQDGGQNGYQIAQNGYDSFNIYFMVVILVTTPMLWGVKESNWTKLNLLLSDKLQIQDGGQPYCSEWS